MFGVLRNFSLGVLLVGVVACDTSEASWRWGGESEPQSDGDGQDEPGGQGEPEAGEPVCDYHTQTRGGWATECSGNNPGCYRDEHFQAAFPNGLWIGDGAMSASLGSSSLVQSALSSSNGPPRALLPVEVGTFDNEGGFDNTLVAQMLALTLNVTFSRWESFTAQGRVPFERLILKDGGPCDGMSVGGVLEAGNRVLGGDSDKSGLTPVEVNECATRINESFIDGEPCCRDMFAFPKPSRRPQTRLPLAAPVRAPE